MFLAVSLITRSIRSTSCYPGAKRRASEQTGGPDAHGVPRPHRGDTRPAPWSIGLPARCAEYLTYQEDMRKSETPTAGPTRAELKIKNNSRHIDLLPLLVRRFTAFNDGPADPDLRQAAASSSHPRQAVGAFVLHVFPPSTRQGHPSCPDTACVLLLFFERPLMSGPLTGSTSWELSGSLTIKPMRRLRN